MQENHRNDQLRRKITKKVRFSQYIHKNNNHRNSFINNRVYFHPFQPYKQTILSIRNCNL